MAIGEFEAGLATPRKHGCRIVFPLFGLVQGFPYGYTQKSDGLYYKYYATKKNWDDAEATCNTEGAHLAIIWDQKTNDVVKGLMDKGWIGLTDKWTEGENHCQSLCKATVLGTRDVEL